MIMAIDEYISSKYGGDAPGSSRFKKVREEIHASQISNCQRKHFWKHRRNPPTEPSVYFELGRMYEDLYGRALKNRWGEHRVIQDVEIEIFVEVPGSDDVINIVGESDWCVLREPFTGDTLRYEMYIDGSRKEIRKDGSDVESVDLEEAEPLVDFVVETKTTKNVKWKRIYGYQEAHLYQLSVYMMAMDVPGEIVYMERNDATIERFEFDRDPEMDLDIQVRAVQHYRNLGKDEIPPTTPMSDRECKYCHFREECKQVGGSVWN